VVALPAAHIESPHAVGAHVAGHQVAGWDRGRVLMPGRIYARFFRPHAREVAVAYQTQYTLRNDVIQWARCGPVGRAREQGPIGFGVYVERNSSAFRRLRTGPVGRACGLLITPGTIISRRSFVFLTFKRLKLRSSAMPINIVLRKSMSR
jgi:hypothetical protein